MSKHVVVGAGQVGSQLAQLLADEGKDVTIVSRSGSGPTDVTKVAADASDTELMVDITAGSDVIYNCVNPPYHRWAELWPPMAQAFLAAAEKNDAVLAVLNNVYGYGPVNEPMTEDLPWFGAPGGLPLAAAGAKGRVRATMWNDALAAHEAGKIRMTEVRGSDYFGPGCRDQSYVGERFVPPILAGKRVNYIHDPDIVHSWTYAPDAARALAIAGSDERAWGNAWHIPTNPPISARTLAEKIAALAHAPAPRITRTPYWLLDAMSVASPLLREMKETRYQFAQPFVLDSSTFEDTFDVHPTSLDQAIEETISWW